jgi:hypothetical protein
MRILTKNNILSKLRNSEALFGQKAVPALKAQAIDI